MKHILADNRYKVCSGWQATELIKKELKEKGCPLSLYQEQSLSNYFGNSGMLGNLDMPFQLYTWEEEEPTGTFLWRLTVPFFFLFTILYLITIHPIHWIITGKETLDCDNWLARFISTWDSKLFRRTFNKRRTE